jgi:predicted phage tail protein
VVAVNEVGDSEMSASFSYIAAHVPSQPGTPYSTATTVSQINIAWTASEDNGSPITHYNIYSSENSGADNLIGTATSNLFSSSGLSMGSNYKFKVMAVNAAGQGPLSE